MNPPLNAKEDSKQTLTTRVTLLEAKVRVMAAFLKGCVALAVSGLVAYLVAKFSS